MKIFIVCFWLRNQMNITSRNLNKIILNNLYQVIEPSKIKKKELQISIFIDGSTALVIKHFRKEVPYTLDEINTAIKQTFKKLF